MKEYEYRKEVYELRQKVKDLENKNIPHVMEEHAKQLKKLKCFC